MVFPMNADRCSSKLFTTSLKGRQTSFSTFAVACYKSVSNCRCLLSRDFVRLGKWFVQPQEGLDPVCTQQQDASTATTTIPATRNGHLSFSFSFFVHGESTVCASIDVRQHPIVRKITHRHLAAAQATSGGVHGTIQSCFLYRISRTHNTFDSISQ